MSVCLTVGFFLKACAFILMMLNGHCTVEGCFIFNFWVLGGHFKVKLCPKFEIFTKSDGKFLVGSRKGLTIKMGSLWANLMEFDHFGVNQSAEMGVISP